MDAAESSSSIGIEQGMRSALVDSMPGALDRIERYNAARERLRLPPYYLATINDVVEGIGCTAGCTARQEKGARLVDVRPGCKTHGSAA